jgi:hypothetical protein
MASGLEASHGQIDSLMAAASEAVVNDLAVNEPSGGAA